MNWNQLEGYWTQFRGKMLEQWGRLMHNDFVVTDGKRIQTVGLLQRRYGAAELRQDRNVNSLKASSDI